MTGQGSERPDKGNGIARPKKRQRQTPKYVLKVSATLPTIAAPSPPSVGPPPTPAIHPPPTPAIDPTPTSAIHPSPTPTLHPSPTPTTHPSPTPVAYPSPTPTADPFPPPMIITPTPPPVHITSTPPPDPTFIPSSSCIPPSETVTPSADQDSVGDAEGVDPPLHDRPWIESYGKGFISSRVASQAITRSIKQQFLSPWPTWGAIPDDDKKPLWQHFQMKVQWKPEHETRIQRNFHMKAFHRLSKMFTDARNAGERPYWLGEHIWNSLLAHWNSLEFRNKCVKAQRNRASEKGGTLHTVGSITIHEHVIRMEEFSTRLSQVRSEHGSAHTPDDASNASPLYQFTKVNPLKHSSLNSLELGSKTTCESSSIPRINDPQGLLFQFRVSSYVPIIHKTPKSSHERSHYMQALRLETRILAIDRKGIYIIKSFNNYTRIQRLQLIPTRWVWFSISMENPKAYNMEDGRRRRTQEEEGSVPTNPSSPPSSPLSEIAPPNDQRPQTLCVSGLNKLSATLVKIASGRPLSVAPGRETLWKRPLLLAGRTSSSAWTSVLFWMDERPLVSSAWTSVPRVWLDERPLYNLDERPLPGWTSALCLGRTSSPLDERPLPGTNVLSVSLDERPLISGRASTSAWLDERPLYNLDERPLYNLDERPLYNLDERPFLSFSGRASPLNVLDERTLAGDERFCMCLLWFAL
ncbi:hypothetical protein LR48_Vigan01g076800 [Vigna angularis]|uniref:Uncharacterized protein n=1 Tax=Phaseolus angularis TaxID=3914 RepID=A0A0L9TKU8_PHAAN|nr:hypothetical protein LR48_Vigan01g076800 [Vigna angularis]